tara:strand:+ start:1282 stop:1425 length:144 start_codon:yes stop_codon:yes gene_type:complete
MAIVSVAEQEEGVKSEIIGALAEFAVTVISVGLDEEKSYPLLDIRKL